MSCKVSILVLASNFLTISSARSMIEYKYKKIEGCERSSSKRTRLPFKGSSLLTTGQCDSVEGNDVYSPLHCITSCKGFKLACINVNSICKHIDEIRYVLINSPLEVLAINESKLDDTISDTEVYIPGYIIIRKDRSRSGGGVALYIRENLWYTNRIDLVPDTLEMICVEINLPHSRSFLVSTW